MHQACCHLLRFDMVQLTPCQYVQFGDGLCNLHVAQELLDYLKQFDTDGKGALSEEELQEVMRGRIGLGTAEKVARGSTDAWLPDEVCLHIEATSCQSGQQVIQVEPACRDSQTIPNKSRNKKKHIETYRHIIFVMFLTQAKPLQKFENIHCNNL